MSRMDETFLIRLCKLNVSLDYLAGFIDARQMNERLSAVVQYENGSITLYDLNQSF